MNIESKSYLVLQTSYAEDIGVEHRNVPTAAFDLKSRTVILPNWKDMIFSMIFLLVMKLAIFVTPGEGWHDGICREGSSFKGYLNVVEDHSQRATSQTTISA